MKRSLLISLICLLFVSCNFKKDKTLIENWEIHPVPQHLDRADTGYYAPHNYFVFLQNNKVHVVDSLNYQEKRPPFPVMTGDSMFNGKGTLPYIRVDKGYLVGFNRGEWGGSLYWFSKDGKQYYKISRPYHHSIY
jgi:hypothetical protein